MANGVAIKKLILVPALITLAVTLLRLVGELMHWSTRLFNPAAGGGGALVGIAWLVPFAGLYFALRLALAGERPSGAGPAIGYPLLVLFQLDGPNRAHAVERVAQPAELLVAVAEVAVDPAPAQDVLEVVGVRQGEPLHDAEMRLDQVEPRGLGRREHGPDPELAEQAEETRVIVDVVQIVQDDKQPLGRVAGAQPPESLEEVREPFLPAKDTAQAIGVDIVEAQKLFGSLEPAVGGPPAQRALALCPSHASHGLEFQGSPFVETDYGRARRAFPVEASDPFFLRSKSGSLDVFQVRMRWAVSPSRRSSRRTHSSLTGGNSRFSRQYSVSLGTDQFENGRPRSAGLERATSTSSRSCSPLKMGGRPFGLATCSKVVNPLLLNRRTQSYATVKWQPILSAASTTPRPWCTSLIRR